MKRSWRNYLYSAWDLGWILADRFLSTLGSRISLTLQGCEPANGFRTTGHCSFKARREGSIRIQGNVTLLAGWRSNRAGLTNPVLIETMGKGIISIGESSGGSAVVISARNCVEIGKRVCVGANVRIYDHDFHPLDPNDRQLSRLDQEGHIRSEKIVIGDDVFIGANSIILKGVTIGNRSIVAAGTVVLRGDYPSECIIAGNPASIIKRKISN